MLRARRTCHLLLGIMLLLLAAAAPQADLQSLRSELRRCIQVTGAVDRLACFERLAQSELQRAPSASENGGSEPSENDESADDGEITSTIRRLERRPHGEYIFYLSNGQVWTELQPSRMRHQTGVEVVLRQTFMGSWMMRVDGGRTLRVRRLD